MGDMMNWMTTNMLVWTIIGIAVVVLVAVGSIVLLRHGVHLGSATAPGQFGIRANPALAASSGAGQLPNSLVGDQRVGDQLRASDADRSHVVNELQAQFSAGRITMEEFEQRIAGAYESQTLGPLRRLLVDLPSS